MGNAQNGEERREGGREGRFSRSQEERKSAEKKKKTVK